MANGKERLDWMRGAAFTARVVNTIAATGWAKIDPVDPRDLMPAWVKDEHEPASTGRTGKSPERVEKENEIAWKLLDEYFGGPV